MPRKKILPPTYFIFFIILSIVIHFLFPLTEILRFPWNLSGVIAVLSGTWLNLVADRAFKNAQTTVKPFEESNRLITTGAFRISRNPMYLGMVSILIGVALLLGSTTPFFIAFTFAVLTDILFIRTEEQMLKEKFGEEWLVYKSKVRRWL